MSLLEFLLAAPELIFSCLGVLGSHTLSGDCTVAKILNLVGTFEKEELEKLEIKVVSVWSGSTYHFILFVDRFLVLFLHCLLLFVQCFYLLVEFQHDGLLALQLLLGSTRSPLAHDQLLAELF